MSAPATTKDNVTTNRAESAPFYRSRLLQEIILVGLGYLVYSQVRGMAAGRMTDAMANAHHLVSVEQTLGIFQELTVQRWVLPSHFFTDVFNVIYFYGFFPFVIPTAIWLYIKRPDIYRVARTAFLTSGFIAVCFFLMVPTAPPRLLGMGFVDTLNDGLAPSYSSIPGVNHFAAFPSMHVGWTFLLAVALYQALPRFRWRPVFFLIPFTMASATVVTGNHWFLDAVSGLTVAGLALGLTLYIRRHNERLLSPLAA